MKIQSNQPACKRPDSARNSRSFFAAWACGFATLAVPLFFSDVSLVAAAEDSPSAKIATETDKTDSLSQEGVTSEQVLWNQWRGPNRDALLQGVQFPKSLKLTQKWQATDLGPSYSGPVSDGKRIFTTATVDKKFEETIAYDLESGKELWRKQWSGSMTVPFFAAANGSWIRSTPACDDQSVYVVGIQDLLLCLNSENGETRWEIDFAKKFDTGNPPFGAVCSPLIDGDFLYLQAANRLFKINKKDGNILWQSMEAEPGMSSGGCFSSPTLHQFEGKPRLLVQSRTDLAAVDPESGRVIWQVPVPNFRGMNILTPTVWKDSVFTSSYNNQSFLFQPEVSADSKTPATPKSVWKSSAKGYMASPVVIQDHAYLLLQNGRLACLNLRDGQRTWTSEKKIGDYVSCVSDGQKILLLTNEGTLLLVQANSEFMDVKQELQLENMNNSWAHVGLGVNDGQFQIFVRSIDTLRVYDWSDQ